MKRLNPSTNKEFKRGDTREDGFMFLTYLSKKKKNGFNSEIFVSPEVFKRTVEMQKQHSLNHNHKNFCNPDYRAKNMIQAAKTRAKKHGGQVTVTWQWVAEKIKQGKCELTGLPFDLSRESKLQKHPFAPSIDRIDNNNRNYEVGNVRIVLNSVNMAIGEHGLDHLLMITDAIKNRMR